MPEAVTTLIPNVPEYVKITEIKMETLQIIFLNAIKENKLVDFLEEKISIPEMNVPLENLPSAYDWTKLLPYTIYDFFSKYQELRLDQKFHDSLLLLINKNNKEYVQGLKIFFAHILFEASGNSPFEIQKDDIIKSLEDKYKVFKFNNLDIDEIKRIVSILINIFNIKITLEL